jgi:hypothetical protein
VRIPSIVMSGSSFNNLGRICVYEWLRGGAWLYVGMSSRGLGRMYCHDKIGKTDEVLDDDTMRITHFETLEAALQYERELIIAHKPLYNRTHNPVIVRRSKRSNANARLIEHISHIRRQSRPTMQYPAKYAATTPA